jgi:hypothetical protein
MLYWCIRQLLLLLLVLLLICLTRSTVQDALMLLEVVSQLGISRWSVALAVLLVDLKVIGPFAAAHPQLWRVFCEQLLAQPELYFLHEVVGALTAAGEGGSQQQAAGDQQELLLLASSGQVQGSGHTGDDGGMMLNSSGLTVRVSRDDL